MMTPLLRALHAAYLAHLPEADRASLEDVLFLAGLPTVTPAHIQTLVSLSDSDLFADLIRDGAQDHEVRAALHALALDHQDALGALTTLPQD